MHNVTRSKNWLIAFIVFIASLLAVPAFAQQDDQKTTIITAARMLDVRTGTMVSNPAIFVDADGRITSISDMSLIDIAGDTPVIDLGNRTLLPGLIDMHVHLDGRPEYGGYSNLQFSDRFWSAIAASNADKMLAVGFTTVRNLGASDYNVVGLDQAIEEGWLKGPRIVTAAHALGATGGHCDQTFLPPSYNAKSPAIGDSPDELRKRVREQRKYGAEVIKACATGGVFSRNTAPGIQQLTLAELTAIADEAHFWDLKAAAHAHGASGILAAIQAGFDTIEHASFIDDAGIKLAKEKGTYLSMDIFNTEYTLSKGAENGVLEENLDKERAVSKVQRENFTKAYRAGVNMVFGSDAGVMPHEDVGGQFAVMVRLGMSPLDALRAATINASAALGQSDDVGEIKVGAYADIIAVGGNPLDNIRLMESVSAVIKGGVVVKTAN
ncbi:Xaa-Pro dipeptidase [Parasphingorhabdus sp. DH2-15]|uniref:Xaa-Pro dipeptidase n=1 Tax=Parasphingorhabdus sp. DH2-15 TaxID=3444112 RepID=UPI003F685CB2